MPALYYLSRVGEAHHLPVFRAPSRVSHPPFYCIVASVSSGTVYNLTKLNGITSATLPHIAPDKKSVIRRHDPPKRFYESKEMTPEGFEPSPITGPRIVLIT